MQSGRVKNAWKLFSIGIIFLLLINNEENYLGFVRLKYGRPLVHFGLRKRIYHKLNLSKEIIYLINDIQFKVQSGNFNRVHLKFERHFNYKFKYKNLYQPKEGGVKNSKNYKRRNF